MPIDRSNSVYSVPWTTPGQIGQITPNTGRFTRIDVVNTTASMAKFSSNVSGYSRLEIEHSGSPGIAFYHGSAWAWSIFSDINLLGSSGRSYCIINESTSKMVFAINGNRSQANVFGGLLVQGEVSNLNLTAPPTVPAGSIFATSMMRPGSFTVATVPSASGNAGAMIYVSNESGGATIAFSDGTNWRRVHDRQIVS